MAGKYITNFKINFEDLKLCDPCIRGKLTQKPFKQVTDELYIKEPLELIHMDLCGPMKIPSLGGARYFFILIDDFTRRYFVYFLKTKDETIEYFMEFKLRYEKATEFKIKNIRTDNGTEFVNKEFENFLKNEGIRHQLTVPYSPQSNGVAERYNRSLIETARTLLLDSELPTEFWAEAVATAAYLKNCTPNKH